MADGYELRPPTREDVDAVVDALNDHSRDVHGVAEASREDILTWFDAPNLDLEQDARVAVLDGQVVGYADLTDDNREHRRYWIDARIRPGHDSSELVAAMERRAAEAAVPGAVVRGFFAGTDEAARQVYEDAGYRLTRHSLRMLVDLAGEAEEPVWPDRIGVRTFEPGEDDRPIYEAHMESFADHWEFTKMPYDEWRHWMMRQPFDPSVWFLACDGDEIAGVCLCRPQETGEPDMGWVSVLGVRPRWRRQGLALALLRHGFGEFRRRGKAKVGLGVDAENTTGAVRLYERAGMRIVRRYDIVEKPVPAPA